MQFLRPELQFLSGRTLAAVQERGVDKEKSGQRRRKACAYVRVSTDEQARYQTSIDSQIGAIENWCAANDADLVDTFVEPLISGADEGRRKLGAMLDRATAADRPYDLVIVYSLVSLATKLSASNVS